MKYFQNGFPTYNQGDGTAITALGGIATIPLQGRKNNIPSSHLPIIKLDAEDIAICKQMNIAPDDYLKTLQENN